jgi:hypothetical protein
MTDAAIEDRKVTGGKLDHLGLDCTESVDDWASDRAPSILNFHAKKMVGHRRSSSLGGSFGMAA